MLDSLLQIMDPLCLVDAEGLIAGLNKSAAELLRADVAWAEGRHHHELAPFFGLSPVRCTVCQAIQLLTQGLPLESIEFSLEEDGHERWLHAVRLPLTEGPLSGGLALLLRDTTGERQRDNLVAGLLMTVARLVTAQAAQTSARNCAAGTNGSHPTGEATRTPHNGRTYDLGLNDPGLTRRELEILRCLVAGMNARDVARRMCLSHSTARNHIQSVLHKLDVHSKAQAVVYAISHGLVPVDELTWDTDS